MVMLGTILAIGVGEELWVRFIPKYLEVLGAGVWGIAVYGTLKDLLDAVYQYPGGWLADRLGRRAALALFTLLAAAGYALYLAPRWEWILAGTLFVMAWSSLSLPAIFAIIGDTLPQTRRAMGFSVQSILKRLPIVLAPPLGGWMIARLGLPGGIRVALLITIALAVLAATIVARHYTERAPRMDAALRLGAIWEGMDRRLRRLLVADCLARLAEGIPKVFIVLFVINVLRQDPLRFGWLTSVQMLTAILVYLPIARLADQMNRAPFVLLTLAFFALFPLALATAPGPGWLLAAFAVGGLREIGEPARKALIVDLAPEGARARTIGLYYMIRGLVVFPASMVGGWLWTQSPRLPFYTAFLIGMAGLLFYARWGSVSRAGALPWRA